MLKRAISVIIMAAFLFTQCGLSYALRPMQDQEGAQQVTSAISAPAAGAGSVNAQQAILLALTTTYEQAQELLGSVHGQDILFIREKSIQFHQEVDASVRDVNGAAGMTLNVLLAMAETLNNKIAEEKYAAEAVLLIDNYANRVKGFIANVESRMANAGVSAEAGAVGILPVPDVVSKAVIAKKSILIIDMMPGYTKGIDQYLNDGFLNEIFEFDLRRQTTALTPEEEEFVKVKYDLVILRDIEGNLRLLVRGSIKDIELPAESMESFGSGSLMQAIINECV